MKIGILKEQKKLEKKVALVPGSIKKLIQNGFSIYIEDDAGLQAGFFNSEYEKEGAKILPSSKNLLQTVDIVCQINPLDKSAIDCLPDNLIVVSFQNLKENQYNSKQYVQRKTNVFAIEHIPRITIAQKMDVLTSMATVAGYKSVLLATEYYQKFFPMLMGAAGTIKPTRVFILGGGIAGLQALATAKRLGAIVHVFDVRKEVEEQVHSLGGKFIGMPVEADFQTKGGYAKEMEKSLLVKEMEIIGEYLAKSHICITTAQVFGKKAPMLVTKDMISRMENGSVLVDLAIEQGGNVELSEANKMITTSNAIIIAQENITSLLAHDCSTMISKNIENFLLHVFHPKEEVKWDIADTITKNTFIIKAGVNTNGI